MRFYSTLLVIHWLFSFCPTVSARRVGQQRELEEAEDRYIIELIPSITNVTEIATDLIERLGNATIGKMFPFFKGFTLSASESIINALKKNPLVQSIEKVSRRIILSIDPFRKADISLSQRLWLCSLHRSLGCKRM